MVLSVFPPSQTPPCGTTAVGSSGRLTALVSYSTKCHWTYFSSSVPRVCGTPSIRLPVCPFPPAGIVAAPCGSPAVCRLRRYYGRIRLLADPSLPPPVSLGGRYSTSRVCSLPMGHPRFPRDLVLFGLGRTAPCSGEVGGSPGFTGSPLESMPRARDSGDPRATSHYRLSGCCLPLP